jgi:hypothetical protein
MGEYNQQIKDVIDSLVTGMPGVKISRAFGYPAYKVNGRIFAFVGDGLAIKLPEWRVKSLVGSQPEIRQFEVADGIVWKAWLSIDRDTPDDYAQDMELIEESLQYVAES